MTEQLSPEQPVEAGRIAGELVKLYHAGAIKSASDPDAEFYAHLIKGFEATFTPQLASVVPTTAHSARESREERAELPNDEYSLPDQGPASRLAYIPTPEQRVTPPPGMKGAQLAAWLQRDIEDAIGVEFLDLDGAQQPFTRRRKGRRAEKQSRSPQASSDELPDFSRRSARRRCRAVAAS